MSTTERVRHRPNLLGDIVKSTNSKTNKRAKSNTRDDAGSGPNVPAPLSRGVESDSSLKSAEKRRSITYGWRFPRQSYLVTTASSAMVSSTSSPSLSAIVEQRKNIQLETAVARRCTRGNDKTRFTGRERTPNGFIQCLYSR